jgi:hypothetical protein
MDFVVHGIPFFSLKEAASIYLHCLLGVLSLLSSTIFSPHSTHWFAVGRGNEESRSMSPGNIQRCSIQRLMMKCRAICALKRVYRDMSMRLAAVPVNVNQ